MSRRVRKGKYSLPSMIVALLILLGFWLYDHIYEQMNRVEIENGSCEFHFVDVGQGDCAMIVSEGGVIVVDAGPQDHAESTREYISQYTDTVDYLILTHPHEDHIGGADEILSACDVKNVIMSDAYTDTYTFTRLLDAIEAEGCNVIQSKAGEEYYAGDIKLTILSPLSEFTDLNDYSVVTRVEYGNTSAILTGDVENHSEGLMLKEHPKALLRADILEIGHHGSSTSSSASFLDAVSPEYAVIQCAEGNSYGHPHWETIKKLEDRDIPYYRTDEAGHVVFFTDGDEIEYLGQ